MSRSLLRFARSFSAPLGAAAQAPAPPARAAAEEAREGGAPPRGHEHGAVWALERDHGSIGAGRAQRCDRRPSMMLQKWSIIIFEP